jgi:hypothetical protein
MSRKLAFGGDESAGGRRYDLCRGLHQSLGRRGQLGATRTASPVVEYVEIYKLRK